MEPRGRLEISSNNKEEPANDCMQNMPGEEDSISKHLGSAHEEAAIRYNSALDMTLKVNQTPRRK